MDIKAFINDNNQVSVNFNDGDFTEEDGFDTAILISLLTDARAPDDRVLIPEKRRGWMGDLESPVENRSLGGFLWLIDQRRLTVDTLNDSINFAQLALNWFVEDGIAKSVTVSGDIIVKKGIQLLIVITSILGKTSSHYVNLWELTGNAT
jgi:phage gp46-like protein